MSFKDEVILSIINNIGLGAIIGFGGFILNLLLERFKTTQALREESSRLRIQKISEIWEELEIIHVRLVRLYLRAGEIKREDRAEHETFDLISEKAISLLKEEIETELLNVINTKIPEVESKIMSYRFWLGDKLIPVHANQKIALERFAKLVKDELYNGTVKVEFADLNKVISSIESTKKDIIEIMKCF